MACKVKEVYKLHQETFKIMIVMQAECAVTTDADFRAEITKVIRNLMPLEMRAHTYRSLFYLS